MRRKRGVGTPINKGGLCPQRACAGNGVGRRARTLAGMGITTERALSEHARRQRGLVTAQQMALITGRADEARRRRRAGTWRDVLPGVLSPATAEADDACVAAAAMLWAPNASLSHFSAARCQQLWVPDCHGVWLTVPYDDPHRSRTGLTVVRTRHPVPARGDGFLRWTPPARTVVDLAQLLPERALSAVLLSAVRRKLATADQVAGAAEPLTGRAGLAVLSRVVGLWSPDRESLLEDRLYEDVRTVWPGEIERQYEVRDRAGHLLGRADVAVPELRLAFESDGLLFHSTDAQIAADQRRDRQFLGAGWQTARFREGAFEDRPLVRRDVAAIVAARAHGLVAL